MPLPINENGPSLDVEYFLCNYLNVKKKKQKRCSQNLRRRQFVALYWYRTIFPRWNTAVELGERFLCRYNCELIQHHHFTNFHYRTLIQLPLLFITRNDSYAMQMFHSMETKNGKTYEAIVLGLLKVTIIHLYFLEIVTNSFSSKSVFYPY